MKDANAFMQQRGYPPGVIPPYDSGLRSDLIARVSRVPGKVKGLKDGNETVKAAGDLLLLIPWHPVFARL
eukprot:10422271-Karenia_brevis.AAC.1